MKRLLFIFLVISSEAWGTIYNYYPDSHLSPGSGFDLYRPDVAFPACVDFDGIESGNHNPGDGVSDNSRVSLKLLKSREDFYQFINYSMSMGGSYKFFSGSASYKFQQEDKFHSDTITWGLVFETNYGIYNLKNPRLKSKYAKLKIDQLIEKCGSEVVLKTRKAVSVFATFTLKNIEESHFKEIISKANVSVSGGVWDAGMKASYTNVLKTALARSTLELEVYAIGGKGIVKLKDLAVVGSKPGETPYQTFEKVPQILADYVATLDESQAAPVTFVTGSMSSLKESDPGSLEAISAKQVSRLFLNYVEAEGNFERIRDILGFSRSRYQLNGNDIKDLNKTKIELNEIMNNIELAARDCKSSNKACRVPSFALPDFRWPQLVFDKCEKEREFALMVGCVSQQEVNISRIKKEVPICIQDDIRSPYELVGYAPCKSK